MKNFILAFALSVVAIFGFGSCQVLSDVFGEDTVITTPSQVQPGAEMEPLPLDTLPAEVVAELPEGSTLVLASRDDLIEDPAFVPFAPGEGDVPGILDALIALGVTFVPGLAAWEGILTLISRRKRKNYAKAIKALAPTDKNVNLGEAAVAVAAALGAAHTSEASKAAAESEEEDWDTGL